MNKRLVAIAWILIVIAVIAAIVYGVRPRQAVAPGRSGEPEASAPKGASVAPTVTIMTINETASSSPTVTIAYPRFRGLPEAFNADIASSTLSRLAEFRQTVVENDAARTATSHGEAALPMSAYSFLATWEPVRVDTRYVSGIERYDSFVGGANDLEELQTFNYDVAAGREMALGDLFPGVPGYLQQIASISKAMLKKHFAAVDPEYTDPIGMLDDGTAPTADNFKDFTFTDGAVTIYFPKYAVAPGSFGEQSATMNRSLIK